ncbi:MAG: PAS domain S-box protein, partial [Verrucomicrobia bacterium]|nr:PAS domain S-box protein [Verrucomicrobiota bacterium]
MPAFAGRDPTSPHLPAATLLIVTADEALWVSCQEAFAHAGLTCLLAKGGLAGLELLGRGGIDLLVIDLPLPDLAPEVLLERHRNVEPAVPLLTLVAPGQERLGLELMRGGALDCLVKDAQPLERLPPAVERAFRGLGRQRQLAAAQEALRESEARHRAVFERASVGMMEGDPQTGRFLRVNEAFCQITGYSAQELQARCFAEITHPEDREADWQAYQRAVRGETRDYRTEKRYIRKDGSVVWVRLNVFILPDAAGRPVRSVGVAEDITERQRAEEALRRSEERLRRAVQIDTVGVLFFTTDGRITDANDAFLRMSGYSREELAQSRLRWDELTPPEWMPASRQAVAEFEATGRTRPYEKEYLRKDGTRWWGLFAATRTGPAAGVEYVIDVSEQKRSNEQLRASEAALRASEERLRFAAQAAGFGIYELDLVTGQAYRSPEYKALFGLQPDDDFQLDADQVPVYVHPDDRALVREATRESRDPQGSGIKDLEYRILLPDGTARWLLVRGGTSFDGAGKARRPVRSRGIALDITDRKQLEQEILEISGREQRRIGHDLHDDLCQRLGGLQLLGGVLAEELAGEGHP